VNAALPVLLGLVVGCVVWYIVMRPMQLDDHERRRRDFGLPPQRELPEDRQ
jgi:xanthine/uracil permease